MSKSTPLSSKQRKNIKKAFAKNEAAIKKTFNKFEKEVLKLHGKLRQWLLDTGGEDPKSFGDGRP